jgi:proteasome lid subunit RPN8/RPN11
MTCTLSRAALEDMHAHARSAYPEECCGILVERGGRQEVVRVTNLQNALHAEDPALFPRTAATAYTMGPEAARVLLVADRGELVLQAFYHSHPDHDAYFSAEDRAQALGGGEEPYYPDARQVVISVRAGEVRATRMFAWDVTARDFVDVVLTVR